MKAFIYTELIVRKSFIVELVKYFLFIYSNEYVQTSFLSKIKILSKCVLANN